MIEELPELPEGWVKCQLMDICDIGQGQSPPSTSYTDIDGSVGVPFLQGNAEFGKTVPTATKRTNAPKVIAREGSVLLSVRAPVGDTNYAPAGETAIGRGLAEVRPLGSISPSFVYWVLRGARAEFESRSTGTTFGAITGRVIKELSVALPPLEEQERIVNTLTLLTELVEGGMDELDAARILLDRMRLSLLDGLTPSDSPTILLSDVAVIQSGITKNRSKESSGREVPYLRTANVQAGFLDLQDIRTIGVTGDQARKHRLLPGDVLVLEGGDADKVGRGWIWAGEIEECLHQNHVFAVRPRADDLDSRFLAYYINAPQTRTYFLGSAKQTTNLASINKTQLGALPIPAISVDAQRERVATLEERLAQVDALQSSLATAIIHGKALHRSLLSWALAGRLTAQLTSDTDASLLLLEIASDRSGDPTPKKRRRNRAGATS